MIVIQGFSDDLGRAGKGRWRKGWDSNPRYPCRHAGFQDRCLKPLGHPSVLRIQGLSKMPARAIDLIATGLPPPIGDFVSSLYSIVDLFLCCFGCWPLSIPRDG